MDTLPLQLMMRPTLLVAMMIAGIKLPNFEITNGETSAPLPKEDATMDQLQLDKRQWFSVVFQMMDGKFIYSYRVSKVIKIFQVSSNRGLDISRRKSQNHLADALRCSLLIWRCFISRWLQLLPIKALNWRKIWCWCYWNTHFNILYLFYFKYTKVCSYEETVNCYVESKSVNRARIYTII